jgi:hypothetical protein
LTCSVVDIKDKIAVPSRLALYIALRKRVLPKMDHLPSWQHAVHLHQTGLEFSAKPGRLLQGDL